MHKRNKIVKLDHIGSTQTMNKVGSQLRFPSISSGEKNLASRFVAGGDRSGSVSANHDDSNSDSDLDSTRPTRK